MMTTRRVGIKTASSIRKMFGLNDEFEIFETAATGVLMGVSPKEHAKLHLYGLRKEMASHTATEFDTDEIAHLMSIL